MFMDLVIRFSCLCTISFTGCKNINNTCDLPHRDNSSRFEVSLETAHRYHCSVPHCDELNEARTMTGELVNGQANCKEYNGFSKRIKKDE